MRLGRYCPLEEWAINLSIDIHTRSRLAYSATIISIAVRWLQRSAAFSAWMDITVCIRSSLMKFYCVFHRRGNGLWLNFTRGTGRGEYNFPPLFHHRALHFETTGCYTTTTTTTSLHAGLERSEERSLSSPAAAALLINKRKTPGIKLY